MFFNLGYISLSWSTCYVVRGQGLRYSPWRGNSLCCVVALYVRRGQRGKNADCLLCTSPTFQWTLPCPCGLLPCCASSQLGCLSLPPSLVWVNVSLTPWLSEFHAVWFLALLVVYWFKIGCYPSLSCARKQSISTYASILAWIPQ